MCTVFVHSRSFTNHLISHPVTACSFCTITSGSLITCIAFVSYFSTREAQVINLPRCGFMWLIVADFKHHCSESHLLTSKDVKVLINREVLKYFKALHLAAESMRQRVNGYSIDYCFNSKWRLTFGAATGSSNGWVSTLSLSQLGLPGAGLFPYQWIRISIFTPQGSQKAAAFPNGQICWI